MTARGIVRRIQCERGQAFVEMALILPIFIGLIFAMAWVGVGFYRYLEVADAAQSAARAGAVARFAPGSPSPCAAADAKVTEIGIGSVPPGTCTDAVPGEDFSVTVEYAYDLHFPFFDTPSIDMKRTVTQRVE